MSKKKPLDPDSTAAAEIVGMEKLYEESAANEQASREQMIAECHQLMGRVQAANTMSQFANVSSLVWLKQVKESKIYKDIPGVGSWDKFCDSVGMSRQKVDLDLSNLAAFGEEFLLTCQQFSLSYRDLRKLRQLTNDGAVQIEDQVITIGDENIPLDADHREDLQDAIERVLDTKTEQLAEATANLKTKDRILSAKEQVINKQEREISRHEARAEKQGYAPGEEEFLKKLDADRIVIDGILLNYAVDPEELRTDLTPRMKAGVVETLGYLRKVVASAHAAAKDLLETPEEPWNGDDLLAEFDAVTPRLQSV